MHNYCYTALFNFSTEFASRYESPHGLKNDDCLAKLMDQETS